MRVIPIVSRLALSVVLAFGICAVPYSLVLQSGRVEPVKQEAHAAAPLVAIPAIAAACGITEEAAIAGIGAIVAGVGGISLYELSQSRGTTIADEAEGYLLLGQATGRLPDLSSPPDPNNQNGNDPESKGNKLKSVLIALATTTGASVAFSALDNLVDTVFDWVTADSASGGAGAVLPVAYSDLSAYELRNVSGFKFYPTYSYGGKSYTVLYGYSNGNVYAFPSEYVSNFSTPLYLNPYGNWSSFFPESGNNSTYQQMNVLQGTRGVISFNASGGYRGNNYSTMFDSGAILNAQFSYVAQAQNASALFSYSNGYLTNSDGVTYSPTGELLYSLQSLPEIIDDSISQYGFATSTESQQTIVNNYINNYMNQPATGDKVTVITIPTVDPGQATYPDYKTDVEPEKVTPVNPKPDTPVTPDTPVDVKKRFEEICGLAFGSVFPFCLIEDLKQLWNKISLSAEPDFKVILPTSEFNVQGADQVVIDASDLAVLGGYVRGFLNLLFVAGLLVLSFRLFLNRGGE